jgi:hypothetical protein
VRPPPAPDPRRARRAGEINEDEFCQLFLDDEAEQQEAEEEEHDEQVDARDLNDDLSNVQVSLPPRDLTPQGASGGAEDELDPAQLRQVIAAQRRVAERLAEAIERQSTLQNLIAERQQSSGCTN